MTVSPQVGEAGKIGLLHHLAGGGAQGVTCISTEAAGAAEVPGPGTASVDLVCSAAPSGCMSGTQLALLTCSEAHLSQSLK